MVHTDAYGSRLCARLLFRSALESFVSAQRRTHERVLPWSLTIADQQPHSTEVIACLDLHI